MFANLTFLLLWLRNLLAIEKPSRFVLLRLVGRTYTEMWKLRLIGETQTKGRFRSTLDQTPFITCSVRTHQAWPRL